jgi:aminopeptidase N
MMDKWLGQGGVPVVSVAAEGRVLTLTQSRFSAFNLKTDTRWSIPVVVRYRLKGERKTRTASVLMETATKSVTLPGAGEILWVYPNGGETGYYRFALSPELLSAALSRRGDLSPVERAGLLNNLWAQVRAGSLPVASFLDHLAAFRGDASRLIIEDAFAYLKTIRQELSESDAERDALGVFAADFFGPLEKRLAWDKKKGESQETTLTRPTVLNALALLAPKALDQEQVSARLKKYLADPSSIDSSLAAVILTAAARRNDPALFEAFRARLAAPRTPEQKSLMLRALAEFSEPALLDRYLAMTVSDEIRAQDAWMPYAWLLANPSTRERTWSFVKANWKTLSAKIGPRGGTRVIGAAGGLVSAQWKGEVESFFRAPDNEIEMARKTLDQTLESIDLGLRFKEGQAASFGEWTRLVSYDVRQAEVGVKAYDRLAGIWGLTLDERARILGLDPRAYGRLKKAPAVMSAGAMMRLSLTLGAYKRLGELLPVEMGGDWLRKPNKGLGGATALSLMTRDAAGLREVRDYLLGVGGGWL